MTPQDTQEQSVKICTRCLGYGELGRDIKDCWMCNGTGMIEDE